MQNAETPTSKYYDKLVLRKLMGIISPEEEIALDTWLRQDPRNREAFETLRLQWEAEKDIIPDDDRPGRWRRRSAMKKTPRPAKVRKPAKRKSTGFYVFEGIAIGALVVAAVLIFLGLKERPTIFHAGRDIRTLTLSDSSTVTLRPGGILLVSSQYGETSRAVEIEGQALVEVKPDSLRPFTLVSEHSRIEVVGTHFAVNFPKGGERDEVIVLSGKVRLNALSNPEKPVEVTAGKKAVFDRRAGLITVGETDTVNATAWRDQRLIFDKTPLSEVVLAIEDYFGIAVEVENTEMLKCPFSRTFSEPRLDDVIKALREGLDVIVVKEYSRIVIDGRNTCPK